MKRILAAAAVAAVASATGGLAGAGELYATGWRPTSCVEPVPPARDVTDATSLNFSVARYNDYVGQVNAYNDCVRAEAERDMAAIRAAAERAQITALRDADLTRLGPGQTLAPPPSYAPPAPAYVPPPQTLAPPPAIGPVLPLR